MNSTQVCPQAHLLRGAVEGAAVDSNRRRIRGEAETSAEDGDAPTHTYTHPGTQKLTLRHKATTGPQSLRITQTPA